MYNENYCFENDSSSNNFNTNNFNLKKSIIKWSLILIGIITIIIVVNKIISYYNSYAYLEKQMINVAQQYISYNNLIVTDEIYLDVNKLDIKIKDNCSRISGVFVDRNYNYQAYLSCDNYQSKIINNDNNGKVSLKGEEVVLIAKGINYQEPGVRGSKEIIIQGEVGTEEGVYNLSYFVNENNVPIKVLKRKVVIVDNDYIKSLFPTITLKGESIIYLQKGDQYNDSGVLAGDNIDFDLSKKVEVTNNVDIHNEGEYDVIYTVTNSRGYTNRVSRKVVVINNFSTTIMTASLSTYNQTNSDVIINIKLIGNNYDYVILPDKTITRSTDISYKANNNDTYYFIAYDKDGKSTTKIIPINNIDKVKPTGVCQAFVYNDYTKVYVTPNSGKKISNYTYLINNNASSQTFSNNYRTDINEIFSASVIIKDNIGNSNTITCEIVDMKNPVYTSNRCTSEYIYEGTRYNLNEEEKKKIAAMVYAEYSFDLEGMKAVASHMANLYEIKKWCGYTNASFYGYISTSLWYADRTRNWTYYNDLAIQAVNDCIVNGNRTLPHYIDEFDLFPKDIHNPLNGDSYVRDITIIKNYHSAVGKFWCLSENADKTLTITRYVSYNEGNLMTFHYSRNIAGVFY